MIERLTRAAKLDARRAASVMAKGRLESLNFDQTRNTWMFIFRN